MTKRDIVDRLRANTEKYPGFENLNTEAAATIETLRAEAKAARALLTLDDEWQKRQDCPTAPFYFLVTDAPQSAEYNYFDARAATDASGALGKEAADE